VRERLAHRASSQASFGALLPKPSFKWQLSLDVFAFLQVTFVILLSLFLLISIFLTFVFQLLCQVKELLISFLPPISCFIQSLFRFQAI
jgi:hypothetical protein